MKSEENLSAEASTKGQATREKQTVALSSVVAAIFLTGMKLVVGVWTGSLGILAEAAHSGLDLVAALVTYGAVRVSDKPADETHHYGHGKVENLSALVEALLLLVTCAWIIYEGINRLFFKSVEIEANVWAFGVVLISITIDFSRSRALSRAAKKHGSQALEADALHFSTDIWSSAVVFVGLALVRINEWIGGPPALIKADAVAALGVALIVIYVSLQLGKRSLAVLLDRPPRGLRERITTQVEQIEGVIGCRRILVRRAGAGTFVGIVLEIAGGASFGKAHEITVSVEKVVRHLVQRADVVVHYEPSMSSLALVPRIRATAQSMGASVHSIWVREVGERYHAQLHLKVGREDSLEQAHELSSRLEARIKEVVPGVAEVVIHIEPAVDIFVPNAHLLAERNQAQTVKQIVAAGGALCDHGACHDVRLWREESGLAVSLHCFLSADMSIYQAHELSEELQARLRRQLPQLQRVVIHPEPRE